MGLCILSPSALLCRGEFSDLTELHNWPTSNRDVSQRVEDPRLKSEYEQHALTKMEAKESADPERQQEASLPQPQP